jgi:N-acyl-D-aspartate/D-glutamate deacylase
MPDLVIRGGTVVDGSGTPGRRADVAIQDGRIGAVGEVRGPRSGNVRDGARVARGHDAEEERQPITRCHTSM